ncbi:hypothetical protein EJ110_NYTH56689 [Nymphaea thermarum]|nr:hypothetical protein EJ110_NYTH56689 [Nymphaea thermarum]
MVKNRPVESKIAHFIGGLNKDIQIEMLRDPPTELRKCFALAKVIEEQFRRRDAQKKIHKPGFVSKPNANTEEILCHALTNNGLNAMKVVGKINNKKVIVLLDTGSTHNFLNTNLAHLVEGKITPQSSFNVLVDNGEKMICNEVCKGVSLEMQKTPFTIDLYLLPIGGVDLVLGIQWMKPLKRTLLDWENMTLTFPKEGGGEITLEAINPNVDPKPALRALIANQPAFLLVSMVKDVPVPYRILKHRCALRDGRQRHEVLIEWEGPDGGTSWEELDQIRLCFPATRAWGQALSEEGGVDTSLTRTRTPHIGTSAKGAQMSREANDFTLEFCTEQVGAHVGGLQNPREANFLSIPTASTTRSGIIRCIQPGLYVGYGLVYTSQLGEDKVQLIICARRLTPFHHSGFHNPDKLALNPYRFGLDGLSLAWVARVAVTNPPKLAADDPPPGSRRGSQVLPPKASLVVPPKVKTFSFGIQLLLRDCSSVLLFKAAELVQPDAFHLSPDAPRVESSAPLSTAELNLFRHEIAPTDA